MKGPRPFRLAAFVLLATAGSLRADPRLVPPWERDGRNETATGTGGWTFDTPRLELDLEAVDHTRGGGHLAGRVGLTARRGETRFDLALVGHAWERPPAPIPRDRELLLEELCLGGGGSRLAWKVGRSRTALGKGVLWNPFDVLDPVNPHELALRRRGGDKLTVERFGHGGAVSSLHVLTHDEGRPAGWSFRHRFMRGHTEIHPFLVDFEGAAPTLGLELVGSLGGTACWLQVGRASDERGRGFQGLVGLDLPVPGAPLIRLEYFHDDLGRLDDAPEGPLPPLLGFDLRQVLLRTGSRRNLGLDVSGMTGTWSMSLGVIRSLDDGSGFWALSTSRALRSDLDLRLAVWIFDGRRGDAFDGSALTTLGLRWKI